MIVEIFSSHYKLEKGALGLFFEMNVLTGIGLVCYTGYIVHFMKPLEIGVGLKDLQEQQNVLMGFIWWNYVFNYAAIAISVLTYIVYKRIDQ